MPLSSPAGGADAQLASFQQQQNQGGASIRLRHHPGGRLSMDMSRAAVTAAGLVPDHYADEQAQMQPHSHNNTALRIDDLPAASASAPPSAYLQRAELEASRLQPSPTDARGSSPAEHERAGIHNIAKHRLTRAVHSNCKLNTCTFFDSLFDRELKAPANLQNSRLMLSLRCAASSQSASAPAARIAAATASR
jgi:hypothetical protein